MLAPNVIEPITLPVRGVHRIEAGQGLRVTCVHGPVWLTQERDGRDIILASGQSFVLDRPGTAVVFAFQGATLTISSPWQLPASTSVPVRAEPEKACA